MSIEEFIWHKYFVRTQIQLGIVNACKTTLVSCCHDDVIKWKHFPRYWPGPRRIPRTKASDAELRCGASMCSLICVWINGWENNRETGDLRRYRAHYDVTLMVLHARLLLGRICVRHETYKTCFYKYVSCYRWWACKIVTVMLHECDCVSNHQQPDCLFNSLLILT